MASNDWFIGIQYLWPQHLVSRLVGYIYNWRWPWFKNQLIKWYIRKFKVDLSTAIIQSPEEYASFNDFFTRELQPSARPISTQANSIICPVDGNISQIGAINHGCLIQAKGMEYSINQLVCDETKAQLLQQGLFATLYLSPKDYHRVHMPITGKLLATTYVPGKLFSVNPQTVNAIPNLFARNERLICWFETAIGPVAVIFVGAIIVASIVSKWAGIANPSHLKQITHHDYQQQDIAFNQAEEIGHFQLGSTVILLIGNTQATWDNTLTAGDSIQMGQLLGHY